jgi:hypothetical protein
MFALPEDHRAACCCAWWERRAKQATCLHTVLRLHREEGRQLQQPSGPLWPHIKNPNTES